MRHVSGCQRAQGQHLVVCSPIPSKLDHVGSVCCDINNENVKFIYMSQHTGLYSLHGSVFEIFQVRRFNETGLILGSREPLANCCSWSLPIYHDHVKALCRQAVSGKQRGAFERGGRTRGGVGWAGEVLRAGGVKPNGCIACWDAIPAHSGPAQSLPPTSTSKIASVGPRRSIDGQA